MFSCVYIKGKKSFKYFSFISIHCYYIPSLRLACGESLGIGSKLFTLAQRLKKAKECCKRLNREEFINIQQRTKIALEELERIQSFANDNPNGSFSDGGIHC